MVENICMFIIGLVFGFDIGVFIADLINDKDHEILFKHMIRTYKKMERVIHQCKIIDSMKNNNPED